MKANTKEPEKMKKMGVLRSMLYTIQTIWKADKGSVLFSFYKDCTEEIFKSFFFVYLIQILYAYIEGNEPYGKLAKIIIVFCVPMYLGYLALVRRSIRLGDVAAMNMDRIPYVIIWMD